ncbi:hypothetical protein ACSFA0_22440 [Variovorax sp. LT1P1]|uniref:hypothetical protein n=1 Tax=Variovorax sp. LT1P1 TaxID=3443730 RepID=UPI003F46BA3B
MPATSTFFRALATVTLAALTAACSPQPATNLAPVLAATNGVVAVDPLASLLVESLPVGPEVDELGVVRTNGHLWLHGLSVSDDAAARSRVAALIKPKLKQTLELAREACPGLDAALVTKLTRQNAAAVVQAVAVVPFQFEYLLFAARSESCKLTRVQLSLAKSAGEPAAEALQTSFDEQGCDALLESRRQRAIQVLGELTVRYVAENILSCSWPWE